jgi:hypothetical protein
MNPIASRAGKPLPQGKISFEEFLAWCDEDTWAEWVHGEAGLVSRRAAAAGTPWQLA